LAEEIARHTQTILKGDFPSSNLICQVGAILDLINMLLKRWSQISNICLYIALRYHQLEMKSILLIGIMALLAIAVTTAGLGVSLTSAQMADNATMGNLTGGNMTTGGEMNQSGSVSGIERIE
jgi:hypothetical protein